MAYISIYDKNKTQNKTLENGRTMPVYVTEKDIRVNQNFLWMLLNDYDSIGFFDMTVGELIKLINQNIKSLEEHVCDESLLYKYQSEPIEKAKKFVLPELKKFNKNFVISIWDEPR